MGKLAWLSLVCPCFLLGQAPQIGNSAVPLSIQAELDQHCAEELSRLHDNDDQSESDKRSKRSSFYSWKLNTCVETVIDPVGWYYEITDATYGFFRLPKWITTKEKLRITLEDSIGWVKAEGYWEPIDPSPNKKLLSMIDATIECTRSEGYCHETDAIIAVGALTSDTSDYQISSWDNSGIVAEDEGHATCSTGHKLIIDFKANSISVIDYPKKIATNAFCKAFQTVNSYTLRGGTYMQMGINTIFYCDAHGASSTLLSKVKERHGDVSELSYNLWQDDGEGGPPASVKTPVKPYSQDLCARLFEQKIGELRPTDANGVSTVP